MPDPFSDKKKQFAARIMKTKNNKIKMNLKGITPKIFITIPLQLEIMSNPSMVNFAKEKNQQILKKSIADHLEKANEDLLKKTQTKLKGIPYPLPVYSKKYFATIQQYKKFDWAKAYPRADIQVKVDITIVDYGNRTKNAKKLGG
jgi:spore germination protein KC